MGCTGVNNCFSFNKVDSPYEVGTALIGQLQNEHFWNWIGVEKNANNKSPGTDKGAAEGEQSLISEIYTSKMGRQ